MRDFYDMYPYEFHPFWQTFTFKIITGTLFLGFIVFISWLIIRWRRSRQSAMTAWEWAEQRIDLLGNRKPTTKKDYKDCYFVLTAIVKSYLGKRYDWFVEDKTDEEFIAFLKEQEFDEDLRTELEQLFSSVVEIKFADVRALENHLKEALSVARLLIERTQPHKNEAL